MKYWERYEVVNGRQKVLAIPKMAYKAMDFAKQKKDISHNKTIRTVRRGPF